MNLVHSPMQNPLVSILTPFKNTEAFLPECIDSILNQTYTDWELIIVDDFSKDNSYKLVENYSKRDSRIKLFKNKEKGIINALRLAFKNSKGDFITRMDSDDIMHEKKLEILSGNLLKHGRQHITLGLVKYFSSAGISDGYRKYEIWINGLTASGANFSEIYKECVVPSPCWMLHREDLIACNEFKPERYPEDYDLTFRFYEQGYKCIANNDVLHFWRDYPTRSSRTQEQYAQNNFFNIKLHYFLKLNHDKYRPLAIWGAGNKGKIIAKVLIEKQIDFYWICNNPNKIGRDIYGQRLHPFNYLDELQHPQSIITVANPQAQIDVKQYMEGLMMIPMIDYFFFC